MRKFLFRIGLFFLVSLIFLELVIRIFNLTDDVPRRTYDNFGLQTYIKNQKGLSHNFEWRVNKYGFLGETDIGMDQQILIIGDSFIENLMNPNDCKQSNLLKQMRPGLGVFEIGRSGITLIEALEFYKNYKPLVKPDKTFLFFQDSDIEESISNILAFDDRVQVDLVSLQINNSEIKSPILKSIYYNSKVLYYFGQKIIKSFHREKADPKGDIKIAEPSDFNEQVELFCSYLTQNYDIGDIDFVLMDNSKYEKILISNGFNLIQLQMDKEAHILEDGHWNCKGHENASKTINTYIGNK